MINNLKKFGIWVAKCFGVLALNTASIAFMILNTFGTERYQNVNDPTDIMEITQFQTLWDNDKTSCFILFAFMIIGLMLTYGVLKFFFAESRADKRSEKQTKNLIDTISLR